MAYLSREKYFPLYTLGQAVLKIRLFIPYGLDNFHCHLQF